MAPAHSLCGISCPTDTPRLPQASSENPDGLITKCRSFWVAVARSCQFITDRPPIAKPGIVADGGIGAGSRVHVLGMMVVRCRKTSRPNACSQNGRKAG